MERTPSAPLHKLVSISNAKIHVARGTAVTTIQSVDLSIIDQSAFVLKDGVVIPKRNVTNVNIFKIPLIMN